jgi:Tfp pilus assembly protein PilW
MKTLKHQQGAYTLVELVVAMTVSGLLIIVIIGFMLNSLTRYGIADARADLINDAQAALDVTTNDVRLSANADLNNRWLDNNAPSSPTNNFSWQSNANTLILATAAQNSSGDVLFSDASKYISHKNNIIYFVNNRILYKRTLATSATGNTAKTTCPASSATTACPADKILVRNVDTFTVKYYNDKNEEVAPDAARSVELYIKLVVVRYPNTVFAEYRTRMVFRNK